VKARVLGVIPARLGSTRLPRKPLHLIADRPLIEWVWRRARESGIFDELVVATDSREVADVAGAAGAAIRMTAAEHPSGTDRVAEVAASDPYLDYPIIVNIQGDEPFVSPDHLRAAVELVATHGWDVGTVATPIAGADEWMDPAVVKVVTANDGGAMLFSRAPVPHPRDVGEPTEDDLANGVFLRHVGIYAYSRDALARWVALPESGLERLERLEQLRALAAGVRIGVAIGARSEPGVDTIEDAHRADTRLRKLPHAASS
jgi:3-deoxy-manno-octulosonate cytidylyltransferase (CMP-KDO synthetase)